MTTCAGADEFEDVFKQFFGAPPDAFEFGCPRADFFARSAFCDGSVFGDGFGAGFAPNKPTTTEAPLTLTLEELYRGAQRCVVLP